MADTIIHDTLKFTRHLQKAGVPEAQAEAFAEAFNEHATTPASKEDIQLVRSDMDARFARLELKFLTTQLATTAAIMAVMAKGFGWL